LRLGLGWDDESDVDDAIEDVDNGFDAAGVGIARFATCDDRHHDPLLPEGNLIAMSLDAQSRRLP